MTHAQTSAAATSMPTAGVLYPAPTVPPAAAPVRPRRPLRVQTPRDDMSADPRRPSPDFNLFTDAFAFDPEPSPLPGTDPRVAASRRRAKSHFARTEASPPQDVANFWQTGMDCAPCDRPAHHATATFAANAPMAASRDTQSALERIRAALYPSPIGPDCATPAATPQLRLAAHAMNATLVLVAFPVGAAVLAHSALRGASLRVSAQAMSVVAAVAGLWHGGVERFL